MLRRKSKNQLSAKLTAIRASTRAPVWLIKSIWIFGKRYWELREEAAGKSVRGCCKKI
jgi:hypothetical protein